MAELVLTSPALSVAAHIALDKLLLREVNAERLPPLFRLCPLADESVVAGTAQAPEKYVFLDRCRADGIPVLKRFSGGGAVFVGRGCIVYSLITHFSDNVRRYDVQGAYRHLLGPIVTALQARGLNAAYEPPCDLAVDGRKIAGNAQAQKRKAVLVHGSFLVNADLARIERYLKHPDVAPEYRAQRLHHEFVANLCDHGFNEDTLGTLLQQVWAPGAEEQPVTAALLEEARTHADTFLV
jgi:lipoate-protein ligase A